MDTYQATQQTTSTDSSSPPDTTKRRHNTLKERIKRSMNKAGEATARRRSSVLAAASALASLAGGDPKIIDTDANTEMVDTAGHQTSKANDLYEERWMAATTSEEVPVTFPQKLMSVLDNEQLSDIITWLPHGKGFIILHKKKFASDIMPLYFKHSKFTSFTRKLNRWGFTRVPKGPETGAYYHKYFQRGNHHLCMQMYCQSKPNPNNSPKLSPPSPVESPEVVAEAQVQMSPVAAALSTLRVGSSSPRNIQENHRRVDFKTTLSRQQELLRKDKEDQLHKKLMQEQHHRAQQSSLAALYHSSRRSRDSPERKLKEQVEVPLNIPPMPLLASSRGHREHQSLTSSRSRSAGNNHHHQSLPSSFTASGTSPYASLRSSWNTVPNSHTSVAAPRAEHPRDKRQHHLHDIDWSKISNYSLQEERRELPGHGVVNQFQLCQPTRQEFATRTQMMPPAQAFGTMRNTLALDTTSSRQHRHVIQNALDALQASNDRGYLTMLMQREHEKAEGRVATGDQYVSQIGVQSRVHAAMQTQMRQLEEYNRMKAVHSEYSPSDLAQRLSRVEQLQQQMKHLSSAGFVQANPQVAHPNPQPKGQYPPGVRRASAA